MLSLVVALVVLAPELPPQCQAPATRDVTPLAVFAQASGSLSAGLDSVATWCFDADGAWTGGNPPPKGKAPRATDATGDCQKAVRSCSTAKAAVSADHRQLLFEALGDLERPFLGVKYKPKRSGIAERPPELADCTGRERSALFSQAQSRMDLARLASQVQSEYANYKTWLFSEGLVCADAVARGEKDFLQRRVAVDAPVQSGGTQQVPGRPGGTSGAGSTGPNATGTGSSGSGASGVGSSGQAGATGDQRVGTGSVSSASSAGPGVPPSGSSVRANGSSGTAQVGTTTGAAGNGSSGTANLDSTGAGNGSSAGGVGISGTSGSSTGGSTNAPGGPGALVGAGAGGGTNSPNLGTGSGNGTTGARSGTGTATAGANQSPAPNGTANFSAGQGTLVGGPTAERELALSSSMVVKWRYFMEAQRRIEADDDWVSGFLASRELRECRCVRPIPGELVRRLENKDRIPQLEADDEKNTRCELCLLDVFPSWRNRVQKQCALALELSDFELGVLQRSDDGNGLPPRCIEAAKQRQTSKQPASVAARNAPGAAYIITHTPQAPQEAPKPEAYAPIPAREEGRVYVRVFTSASCVTEILPGPVLARTGDLLPVPPSAKEITVRGVCGGFAELYFGKEEKPRVAESFARNQPLRLQFRP